MRVLCVYATRQVDSNLMMSSTVFNGLHQCGYVVDVVFMGPHFICDVFDERYSKYFHKVYYLTIKESAIKTIFDKNDKTQVLYSFYIHFVKDFLLRPYNKRKIKKYINESYDVVLSFIPPALSGYLAWDIKQNPVLKRARLIQFWTDPLSLGRCNDISDIPRYRFMHKKIERQLLGFADKVVFCYPLLCEMEQKLHPEFKQKMTWSDVGYTEHIAPTMDSTPSSHKPIKIGLFGSYHSSVRNISPLLEATKSFPNAHFIVRGDSDITIMSDHYSNVDAQNDRIAVEDVEALEQSCDILVILGNKGGIQIPGKTYYYANYNKPLICICDSVHAMELKEYLRPLNRYIVCDNEVTSIINAIQEAIEAIRDFQLIIPERLQPNIIARKIVQYV